MSAQITFNTKSNVFAKDFQASNTPGFIGDGNSLTNLKANEVIFSPAAPNQVVFTDANSKLATSTYLASNLGGTNADSSSSTGIARVDGGTWTFGPITSADIGVDAIGTAQIQDGAVTTPKLADDAVTAAKLADGSVSTASIQDAAITVAKMDSNSVNSTAIQDSSITSTKIDNNAVTSDKISDSSITTQKIADGAVQSEKIEDNAIITSKIADAAVTSAKIADNAVTTVKIADSNVTGAKIAEGTITGINIEDATIPDSKLQTISTAGKVANSATSASSASSPNTIVLRDGDNSFQANTITVNKIFQRIGDVTTVFDSNSFNVASGFENILYQIATVTDTAYLFVVECVGVSTTGDIVSLQFQLNASNVGGTLTVSDIPNVLTIASNGITDVTPATDILNSILYIKIINGSTSTLKFGVTIRITQIPNGA